MKVDLKTGLMIAGAAVAAGVMVFSTLKAIQSFSKRRRDAVQELQEAFKATTSDVSDVTTSYEESIEEAVKNVVRSNPAFLEDEIEPTSTESGPGFTADVTKPHRVTNPNPIAEE